MLKFLGTLFSFAANSFMFAIGGIAAVVYVYDRNLPNTAELADYSPPLISRVYDDTGTVIAQYYHQKRIFVPIQEVPKLVKDAFISAEDKHFYTHPGIDAVGILKAVGRYAIGHLEGHNVRLSGASTITQQVMKNFLVGNERTVERKVKEAILAVRISKAMPKSKVLELYLNEIFLGQNTYGVAAAAQTYFGKSLQALTPAEAAYLAALPKEPSNLSPIRDHDAAVARRNYVLEQMAENGYLTRAQAKAAKASPLDTIIGKAPPPMLAEAKPSYFSGEVRRQMIDELGEKKLYEGGLTIRSTLDPELQKLARQALRHGLEHYDRSRGVYHGPQARIEKIAQGGAPDWKKLLAATDVPRDIGGWHPAVVLSVDGKGAKVGIEQAGGDTTGRLSYAAERGWIKAVEHGKTKSTPHGASDLWQPGDVVYVAHGQDGKSWRLEQIPKVQGAFMAMDPYSGRVLAMQGGFSYDASVFNRATQAKRQPGSAFKPFVYAAALDAGYTPATIVLDAPVVVRQPGQQPWRPQNAEHHFLGPTPMRRGLELSRNLMTVRIAQAIGMDRVANYAERFGVYKNMPYHLSYALGAGETTLYDLVGAYATFANGGKKVRPTVVDRVQDRYGHTLYTHDPRKCVGCKAAKYVPGDLPQLYDKRVQIMDPVTAYQIVSMMEGVVKRGTAAQTVGDLGFPVAGKTGTTNDARDAWFIGYTPDMVAGCFIGYDTPTPMGRHAYGGTLCGPVFKEFIVAAMKDRSPGQFRKPPDGSIVMAKIDEQTGERLPDDASGPHIIDEIFRAGTEPAVYDTVVALTGDESLFAGVSSNDIKDINASSQSPGSQTVIHQPQPSSGQGDIRAPSPPSQGSIGVTSGGIY